MLRVLSHHWRASVTGLSLLALAGCAGHYLMQREPWRKEAELTCLQSGAVKESGTIVRIEPINGPGMCGADFPLKVAALGDQPLLGYSDLRPPASVPNAGPQRWPVTRTPAPSAAPQATRDRGDEPQFFNPLRRSSVQREALPPPSANGRNIGAPLEIVPSQQSASAGRYESNPWRSSGAQPTAATRRPSVYDPPSEPEFDDADVVESKAASSSPFPAPLRPYQPQSRSASTAAPVQSAVPLGRSAISALGPVEIKPAATLACPMVSKLDRWIIDAVQPAARRWFRQPVVEIRQISAYSCRGMNGQRGARISEHAFGNALDVSSFTLADGRRITVKNGWRGSPEEQGFLRDVQGAACEMFNTVLAPGSNRFHYDHFHFDLMRRRSGNRICNPDQIPGDVVAARVARERGYAWRPEPGFTGAIGKAGSRSRSVSLGGKPKARSAKRNILDDDDWIEDEGPRPAE